MISASATAALLAAVAVLGPPPASGQHTHKMKHAPAGVLLPGMGNLHFPITTSSPRAQKFFDQGMTLIYAFNHDESARSFRQAAPLDPKAAMPHWGIALAIGPNYNDTAVAEERAKATSKVIQKAKALASGATARERDYIDALAKRFAQDSKSDWPKLWLSYSEAMGELQRRYPDDPDAATLYAESLMMLKPWQLWKPDGTPADGTLKLVSVLEDVLKHHPEHVGASHNLHFIAVGYAEAGSYTKAIAAARALAENARAHLKAMPMIEGYLAVPRFVMLRSQRWDAVLAEKAPDPAHVTDTSLYHYARALALLKKKDREGAESEQALFAAARAKIAGDAPFSLNTAAAVVNVAASVLEARLAEAGGDTKAALDHWHEAVAAQDALNYDEPPPWYYPVRESLGGALLRGGDAIGAEKTFREDLERNPRNPRSLLGLREALKVQNRAADADLVRRQLAGVWKGPAAWLTVGDL